jgi:multiple sugar transport system substrate-binding protein
MRAAFAAILAVLIVLTLWATSHKPKAPSGKVVLTWVTDDNPARQEQMRLFREFCRRRGRPDIDIRLDTSSGTVDKVVVQCVGGVGPDLFDIYGTEQLVTYAGTGIALDVTDVGRAKGFGLDVYWPALAEACAVDGRQYSVPTNCAATAIFYNKDVFDRLGVPYPKGDWTWEQFVATAKRLTTRKKDGRGYETFGVMAINLEDCIWQAGGRILSDDGLTCLLDSPEAIEGARFYRDLQYRYHVMPTVGEENAVAQAGGWGQGFMNYFLSGHVAMISIGRYAAVQWRQHPELRWGAAPLPRHRAKVNRLAWRSTAVNRKSPHLKEALMFLEFLVSPEYCRQINDSADGISAIPKYEASPEFLHNPAWPRETDNDVWLDAMRYTREFEVSPFIAPAVERTIFDGARDLIRSNARTPEQAMRDAAARMNAVIRRNIRRDPVMRERYQRLMQEKGNR